jgi:hypothetical protein
MKEKGKHWTQLHEAIDNNLRYGDVTAIAKKEKVEESFVSSVRHGHAVSRRIFAALQNQAMWNKRNLIEVADYLNKPLNLSV